MDWYGHQPNYWSYTEYFGENAVMERNHIPAQTNPRFGYPQNTGVQFRPGVDTGQNLSTSGQTLPPPPPLVRHGAATSSATVMSDSLNAALEEHFRRALDPYQLPSVGARNVTPTAATMGSSMGSGSNPTQSSFSGAPQPASQQFGTNWSSPGSNVFTGMPEKMQRVPGNPLIRQALQQQGHHEYNISMMQQSIDKIVTGGYTYGGFPDRLGHPERLESGFQPRIPNTGSQSQNVPSNGRRSVPNYPQGFNGQPAPPYNANSNQFPVNQPPAAHQNFQRVPQSVPVRAHSSNAHSSTHSNYQMPSQGQAAFNPRPVQTNTYGVGQHPQRPFGPQSVQGHISPSHSPFGSQPAPGHISTGQSPFVSQTGQIHISQGQNQSRVSSGQVYNPNSHFGMDLRNQSAAGSVQRQGNLQGQGHYPGQTQMQPGSVNGQGYLPGMQQCEARFSPDGFLNITNAANSLSQLSDARRNPQAVTAARYRFLQLKEKLEVLEKNGKLAPGETAYSVLAKCIANEKERLYGAQQHAPKSGMAQTHVTTATVSSPPRVRQADASAIMSAFSIPVSQDDKAVLGRWYAPPSSETPASSQTPEALSSLQTTMSNAGSETSVINSNMHNKIHDVQSHARDEPFVLKPTVCTEDKIEYKVADLLRCLPRKARSRHTSSVDSNKSMAPSMNETNIATENSVPVANETSLTPENVVPLVNETNTTSENVVPIANETNTTPENTVPLTNETNTTPENSVPLVSETNKTKQSSVAPSVETEQILISAPSIDIPVRSDTVSEKEQEKEVTREITPDLDEQLMEADSFLDFNKKRVLDGLVLDSQFGTQDMNPDIDYRTYLPSPGLPPDFVMTPSPGPSSEILPTADFPPSIVSPKISSEYPAEKLKNSYQSLMDQNSADSVVEKTGLNEATEVNDPTEKQTQKGKKRKRSSANESYTDQDVSQGKRQRGGGRGRRGQRGRPRGGTTRGRGRGNSWTVSPSQFNKQSKFIRGKRPQTARCSRGRGGRGSRGGRGRGKTAQDITERSIVDVDVTSEPSRAPGLDGHVIQKPQDLKKLMDNLPSEELENTTVSLSTLKMMLAWQEAETNAGPDEVDQDSDAASVCDGACPDDDAEKMDSEAVISEENNKEHNMYEPPDDSPDLQQSKNSEKVSLEHKDEEMNRLKQKENVEDVITESCDKSKVSVKEKAYSKKGRKRRKSKKDEENVVSDEKSDQNVCEKSKSVNESSGTVEGTSDTPHKVSKSETIAIINAPDISSVDQNVCEKSKSMDESSGTVEGTSDTPHKMSKNETIAIINAPDISSVDQNVCEKSKSMDESSGTVEGTSDTPHQVSKSETIAIINAPDISSVDSRIATQIYSVTATHKMTWVRYHGRTVTQLITPNGCFFILKEILRRCFRIQEPNKRLKFHKIGILKTKTLEIPDIELEPLFYDYVVKNLVDRKVIKTIPEKFTVISEKDANRLFHYVCKDRYCEGSCVTPFFQKQQGSALKPEVTGMSENGSKSEVVASGADTNSEIANFGQTKKDRNLFDFIENEASPKIEKSPKKGKEKVGKKNQKSSAEMEIINLCTDDESSDGYGSDKTLPYVEGDAISFDQLEKIREKRTHSSPKCCDKENKKDNKKTTDDVKVDSENVEEIGKRKGTIKKAQEKKKDTKLKKTDKSHEDSKKETVSSEKKSLKNSAKIDIVENEDGKSQKDNPISSANVKDTHSESQGNKNVDNVGYSNTKEVLKPDVIVIDDDEEINVSLSMESQEAKSKTIEAVLCQMTVDKMKKEFNMVNNSSSKESEGHSAELVQVNNIDSTAVGVSGEGNKVQNTGIGLVRKLRNIFTEIDEKIDQEIHIGRDSSQTMDIQTGTKDKEKICSDVHAINDRYQSSAELESDATSRDVIVGDWVFPAPPKTYPEDGTKKLEQASETLDKIIETANGAKKNEDYVDILDKVFRLTEPLKQWTNTLLDHYEEGLLIEAQRLKSLDQLQLTDTPIDLDDDV